MIRHLTPTATVPAALLLLLLVWTPLPFGSVLPFDRAALHVGCFLAFAIALLGDGLGALQRIKVPVLAVAAIGCLGLVQALPWPRTLTEVLSPRSVEVADRAASVLAMDNLLEAETATAAGDAPTEPAWVSPSLVPPVSRATALQWLAMAAALGAACMVGRHRILRRLLALGLLVGTVFEVVYGSDRWFKGLDTIWGIQVPGDVGRLRGTFVNPDHLALLLGLGLGVCTAWGWWAIRRLRYGGGLERRLLQVTPPVLVFVMLFAGIAFTGSRGGLLAVVGMLVMATCLLAWHYRSKRVLAFGFGALALGFAAVALFGWQAGFGRWLETSAYELTLNRRFAVYGASVELWLLFPWLGSGLGTFREAFPLVQSSDLAGTWLHAHGDLLELLVTAGLASVPIVVIGCVYVVRRLLLVLQRGQRSEDRAAGLAGLAALTMALLASLVDFGLTMPANAFALAVLVGLCAGAPTGSPERLRNR